MRSPSFATVGLSGSRWGERVRLTNWRRVAAVAAGAVVCVHGGVATASTNAVTPAEDNPPGCVTATSEDATQCGAQGRDHFAQATHKPPIQACLNVASPAGSVLTRVVPDGPRRPDGTLAFVSGACVYLPPGYASGALRYPTIYLLHGGGGDEADWVTFGGMQKMFDDAFAASAANATIVVMPDGRSGMNFDYVNAKFLNETYFNHHLVPFIDAHFRTIADRRGRAVIGLSNGGYGALHYAAKAPDLFSVAGSMSGNVAAQAMGDLGTPLAPTVTGESPSFQQIGASYYGSQPLALATNLDPVDITMDIGATCQEDLTVDLCLRLLLDRGFIFDNEAFRDALHNNGYTGTLEYRESEGAHAWKWWTKWLRERQLPFALARLRDPQSTGAPLKRTPLPTSFRYRSIAPAFSIFGYDVRVTRDVKEFLDLTHVTQTGLTAAGTGAVRITTAPRYTPRIGYVIRSEGHPDAVVNADTAGRLTFPVDLGPSHTDEQYSPAQRAAEASGAWHVMTRSFTIAPTPAARPAPRHRPQRAGRRPPRSRRRHSSSRR